MAGPAHPTDALVNDLVGLYDRGRTRLELAIGDGLRRGLDPDRINTPGQRRGDATAAYRDRQRRQAIAIADQLRAQGGRAGAARLRAAYGASLVATDRVLARTGQISANAVGRFGGVHRGVVDRLAGNLDASLTAATAAARQNIDDVFARAAALDGPLPIGGDLARIGFIGRRQNDAWRRLALEELGTGKVALETRRQITKQLVDRLVRDGIADALTGYVDRAGRRWALDRYAEMVTRTTTREAASAATATRMREHGLDLITISSHPHNADECTPYDGGTFSLSGESDRYDAIDDLPPFHPNCEHVATPGGVDDEDFNAELERAVDEALGNATPRQPAPSSTAPPAQPPRPPTTATRPSTIPREPDGIGRPPLSATAEATRDAGTIGRLADGAELERLIAADPGLDVADLAARNAWLDEEGARRAAVDALERAAARSPAELVDEALGPDVVAALEDLAKSGFREARELDFRQAIVDGELSLEDAYAYAEDFIVRLEGRRADRERAAQARGYQRKPIPCFVCGRFKRMPADVCPNCGDDPITHNATSREIAEFNESYGYEPIGSRTDPTDFGGKGIALR